MTSNDIRRTFLEFFRSKKHLIVPSAPLVAKDDPTLMFTNSGMAPFKDCFLGNREPESRRIADTQKCLRVSGKHNDLEDVGYDGTHHTMFEMLGNWSFGDYFKDEAIAWSWELLTEVYKMPKDRLYATVFGGDAKENLAADEEAKQLWLRFLPEDHILYGNKKDNFWEMGDTGPCGPCSEIHIDLRSDEERAKEPGNKLVNQDHPLVIEIWNNVFMQFERRADRSLVPLPAKHVDTGMGFERLCMVLQGVDKTYDTDIFRPMIAHLEKETGVSYTGSYERSARTDIAMRVCADHIRAVAFVIADGQLPSNTGAGYVIRRILRRAVRYGYTFLGYKEPFMYRLVPMLAAQLGETFPEIRHQADFVQRVIQEEESSFLRTLENGLRILGDLIEKEKSGSRIVTGKTVFELYDTYGFPVDLTDLIAREHGFAIDKAGFDREMEVQKNRSRDAAASEKSDWVIVREGEKGAFVGYDQTESTSHLLKYREIREKKGTYYQIVLDVTPFYPEGGGQVGDQGVLTNGQETVQVMDTQKENDLIIHLVRQMPKDVYATFQAKIDVSRRRLTENNHSATHLLHAALRRVLGTHVAQKGSLVNPEVLRFDFSHPGKVTDEEIRRIEEIVNQKIRENIALDEQRQVPIEKAKSMGAMALFGEKYGDQVRVITFDPAYSIELCGGTHVPSTGKIGFFKITAESSVAAGVRRVEALTSVAAEQLVQAQQDKLEAVSALLGNPKDLVKAVEKLQDERDALAKEVERLQQAELQVLKERLVREIEERGGVAFLARQVQVPKADNLRQLAFELRAKVDNLVLVLAAEIDQKPQLAVMVSDKLVTEKGLNAAAIVKDLAKDIQGGGGGQPFFATAGGKLTEGLPKAISRAQELV